MKRGNTENEEMISVPTLQCIEIAMNKNIVVEIDYVKHTFTQI